MQKEVGNFDTFMKISRILAFTNFLQFLTSFFVVGPYYNQFGRLQSSNLLQFTLLFVLLVDLAFTLYFLLKLGNIRDKVLNPLGFYGYGFTSLAYRVILIYQIRENIDLFNDTILLMVLVAILFGYNLYQVAKGKEFPHQDKLLALAWANMLGITAFLGNVPLQIFSAIKIFLPLPASFVYFVLSFDIGLKDEPIGEENTEREEDLSDEELFIDDD